ncbi:MAG: acyltransferase [Patescibacteria group bacterium]
MNTVFFLQNIYNKVVFGMGKMRANFWKTFFFRMGKDCYIMSACHIGSPRGISFGKNVTVNHHTNISGHAKLIIGNYVMIGPNCNIITANHGYGDDKKPMMFQDLSYGSVEIEDDVWLGANVVVLPNIKIGRGSIVGANAVVTKNVEPYSIVGGVPAKLIKYRFSEDKIKEVKKIDWNKFNK